MPSAISNGEGSSHHKTPLSRSRLPRDRLSRNTSLAPSASRNERTSPIQLFQRMTDRQRLAADQLNCAVDDVAECFGGEHFAGDHLVDDVYTGFTQARRAIQHAARGERANAQIGITQPHTFARAERFTRMMRRLQMVRRELDCPTGEPDRFGCDQQPCIADLPHRARQTFAGTSDHVIGGHEHVVEAERRMVAAVERVEAAFDDDTRRFRVDHEHRAALALEVDERVQEIRAGAAGDVRFAAVDAQSVGGCDRAREMRRIVGFGEREPRTQLARKQRQQIAGAQRFRAAGEHAGPGTERVVGKSGVERRKRVAHDRQRKRTRFAAADRTGLRHRKKPGFACGVRDVRTRLRVGRARRQSGLVGKQHVVRETLRAFAQFDEFRCDRLGHLNLRGPRGGYFSIAAGTRCAAEPHRSRPFRRRTASKFDARPSNLAPFVTDNPVSPFQG